MRVFADDIESVLLKLEQRMSPEERADHASFGERFAYIPDGGTKPYVGKNDVLDALLSGVLSRKLVRYAYRGARGRATMPSARTLARQRRSVS